MAKKILIALAVLFVILQFVPGKFFPTGNPAVDPTTTLQATARKLPPEVAAILDRSCRDCHSSQTAWPWYGKVAPISWLLSYDVAHGRQELNMSEWGRYAPKRKGHKLEEICEQVKRGEMPLSYYLPLHPGAKLSEADRTAICVWTREESVALGLQ